MFGAAKPIGIAPPVGVPHTPDPGVIVPPGTATGRLTPGPLHALGDALNAPRGSRVGRSKKRLFQIEFSKNNPTPARTEVLPFINGSQANPTCGAKFEFGCLTRFPSPGSSAFSCGITRRSLSV